MTLSLKVIVFGRIPVAVAHSLKSTPEKWSLGYGAFEVGHNSGISVWIASGVHGVAVYRDGARCTGGALVWGGVTGLSALGLSPGHHYLHHAVNRWLRRTRRDIVSVLAA